MKLFFYSVDKKVNTDRFILKALEEYLAEVPIKLNDKAIYRTQNGKPYFADNALFVGVSHSYDVLVIAFDAENFGIDCEKIVERDFLDISRRFFNKDEQALIKEAKNPFNTFLGIWTKKEAYIKCFGKTLSSLSSIDTTNINGFKTFEQNGCIISVFKPQN